MISCSILRAVAGFPPDLPTLRLLRGTRRAIMGATASREMGRATSPRGYRALSRARKNPVLALARGEEEGAEPLDKHQERGMKIVAEIASLHQRVERTIDRLRAKLDEANELVNDSKVSGQLGTKASIEQRNVLHRREVSAPRHLAVTRLKNGVLENSGRQISDPRVCWFVRIDDM
jgi:hypothetical protein